jgi:hypothetical protein
MDFKASFPLLKLFSSKLGQSHRHCMVPLVDKKHMRISYTQERLNPGPKVQTANNLTIGLRTVAETKLFLKYQPNVQLKLTIDGILQGLLQNCLAWHKANLGLYPNTTLT